MKAKQVSQLLLTVAKHLPSPSFNLELAGFEQLSLMDYFYSFSSSRQSILRTESDNQRHIGKLPAHALHYGRGFNKSVFNPYTIQTLLGGAITKPESFPTISMPKLYNRKES